MAARRIGADNFGWAPAYYSGYIPAEESYDGLFSVLSIVDNRPFKRLVSRAPGHDPVQQNVATFFRRFHAALGT